MGALRAFAEAVGVRVAYVKPHGALYNAVVHHEGQTAALVEAVRPLGDDLVALGLRDRLGCVVPRTPAPCGAHRPRHPRPTRDDDGGSRSPALSRRHAWPAHRGPDEPGPRDLRRLRRRRPRHRRRSLQYVCRGGRRARCPDEVGGHLPRASPISPAHAHERGVVGDGRRRPGRARLQGPTLARAVTDELPSEEVVRGSVQVSSDGQPTLFLSDHLVTGAYPVIAVLTAESCDRAAQLVPGARVRLSRAGAPARRRAPR